MDFRIADTFTDSLARLTGEEHKAVKTTAFYLQLNPANPGLSLHKLDKARDKNFWSVRVSSDIRLIVHKRCQAGRPSALRPRWNNPAHPPECEVAAYRGTTSMTLPCSDRRIDDFQCVREAAPRNTLV